MEGSHQDVRNDKEVSNPMLIVRKVIITCVSIRSEATSLHKEVDLINIYTYSNQISLEIRHWWTQCLNVLKSTG